MGQGWLLDSRESTKVRTSKRAKLPNESTISLRETGGVKPELSRIARQKACQLYLTLCYFFFKEEVPWYPEHLGALRRGSQICLTLASKELVVLS